MQSDLFCLAAPCRKSFNTLKGLNSHLFQAKSCLWYCTFETTSADQHFNSAIAQDDLSEELMEREGEGPLEPEMSNKQAEHQTGGALICMDQSLHDCWQLVHNPPVDVPMDGINSAPENLYAPFASEMDWHIVEWVVTEKLGLSYKNIASLHKSVDSICPCTGEWKVRCLHFNNFPEDKFILCHCNILEVEQSLWGDPSLAKHLVYRPKSIFQDEEKKQRTFSEMWMGKWWQYTQDWIPEGATVAPLIIATNKSQLTQFSRSKQLNKEGLTKHEASGRYQCLFHDAMHHIMSPLFAAGKDGVDMPSADGEVCWVHPILASYVADFPEQCMVTCTKYGTCPKCCMCAVELGDPGPSEHRTNAWTLGVMKEAHASTTLSAQYFESCMKQEVSGYTYCPFWDELPFCDIHFCITPDVLHQLYQGVLRYIITWCQRTEKELDHRIHCLPPVYGVQHFKNRISALPRISGAECKNMGKTLLGCLVGSVMPIVCGSGRFRYPKGQPDPDPALHPDPCNTGTGSRKSGSSERKAKEAHFYNYNTFNK
ncbi:hypothetical protein BT96DRAFT_1098666 [Gymnopus androsaceus JB14]|uniref:C2H2-type domain-containing protein n=1 Tax=Gymnopus androsaceus JB14 TaxID=1447944 RepID=A0A6A4GG65_9AGAR|nr:hypothetical protein BT96DRAFT_1098666 [Gymnopus androsaceus JB14]